MGRTPAAAAGDLTVAETTGTNIAGAWQRINQVTARRCFMCENQTIMQTTLVLNKKATTSVLIFTTTWTASIQTRRSLLQLSPHILYIIVRHHTSSRLPAAPSMHCTPPHTGRYIVLSCQSTQTTVRKRPIARSRHPDLRVKRITPTRGKTQRKPRPQKANRRSRSPPPAYIRAHHPTYIRLILSSIRTKQCAYSWPKAMELLNTPVPPRELFLRKELRAFISPTARDGLHYGCSNPRCLIILFFFLINMWPIYTV